MLCGERSAALVSVDKERERQQAPHAETSAGAAQFRGYCHCTSYNTTYSRRSFTTCLPSRVRSTFSASSSTARAR